MREYRWRAAAAASALVLFASVASEAASDGNLWRDMRAAATAGWSAQERGDQKGAAEVYGAALRRFDEWQAVSGVSDGQAAPFLEGLLIHYSTMLLATGHVDEAANHLERLLAALRSATTNSEAARVASSIGRSLDLVRAGSEMARAMNAAYLLVEDEQATPVERILAPRISPSRNGAVLLAQARARQGRAAAVLALWEGEIRPQIERATKHGQAEAAPLLFQVEVDLLRSANALAAAGHGAAALEALDLALAANLVRLREFISRVPLPAMQLEAFQQRRILVSAMVSQVAGNRSHPAQLRRTVAAIASAKSLASRFAERRRLLLAASADPSFFRARSGIEKVERDLLSLPLDGTDGVTAWVAWQNAYAAALSPAIEPLRRAGLAEVFSAGDDIVERVTAKLGGSAWIGFMVYTPVDPSTAALLPQRYVRYTIDRTGMSLKDLGPRRDLDRAVSQWRSAAAGGPEPPGEASLAALLVRDLPESVHHSNDWIVEPDGMLGLLPLEALPDPAGGLVLDHRAVRYATSLAQFAGTPPPVTTSREALIVGDPSYAREPPAAAVSASLRSGTGDKLREMRFTPLPETRGEARGVAQAVQAMGLKSRVLLGAEAQAAALREARAPRILHVASHAFVLAPSAGAGRQPAPRFGVIMPGLLAGLAVTPGEGADNGLLLAHDMARLDLRGTELVVLSACDTGNGLVDVGEGFAGLRRAVEEAGALATLTSLWPVRSDPTVRLMTEFYRQLAAGRGHAESLRQAKLLLRREGALPYDWAGFVLAGASR